MAKAPKPAPTTAPAAAPSVAPPVQPAGRSMSDLRITYSYPMGLTEATAIDDSTGATITVRRIAQPQCLDALQQWLDGVPEHVLTGKPAPADAATESA